MNFEILIEYIADFYASCEAEEDAEDALIAIEALTRINERKQRKQL